MNKSLLDIAKKEVKEELKREEIDKIKAKLKSKKTILDRLVPFKIVFIRKENLWKS